LDTMRASGSATILNISAPSTTKPNFHDLQGEQKFNSLTAFGASVMENMLYTFALARKLQGSQVTANVLHPGLMKSQLMSEAVAPLRFFLGLISKSPSHAAQSIVKVTTNSTLS